MANRLAKHRKPLLFLSVTLLLVNSINAVAQTTAFTYQGKLNTSGNPATGNYDLQFKLFDTGTVGTGIQQGSTVTVSNVIVSGGIFTVSLDFGACASCFNGANRFLEIAVKLTSDSTFTTLTSRQPITSTPYAIRSLNSTAADGLSVTCVNCITSSQIQSVNGSAVSGTIPVASVPAGSPNYIRNTTKMQTDADFNISGSGTAGGTLAASLVDSATQYNIGGTAVVSLGSGVDNLFVGPFAGQSNPTGSANSFFGVSAVFNTTTGTANAFFGRSAGFQNTGGSDNSFFGVQAGRDNSTGNQNAFFGRAAGISTTTSFNSFFGAYAGNQNTTGAANAFFGSNAGRENSTGDFNAFFGSDAGRLNTTGELNAFFGNTAGFSNTTGDSNAFFVKSAGETNTTGNQNAFFGAFAGFRNTTGENNVFFGAFAGRNNTTGQANAFFGNQAGFSNMTGFDNAFFGRDAGFSNTTGDSNTFFGFQVGYFNTTGQSNAFFGNVAGFSNTTGSQNTVIGNFANVGSGNLNHATAIGADAVVSSSNTIVLGRGLQDNVVASNRLQVRSIPSLASIAAVCFNAAGDLMQCGASSLRWKTNVQPFRDGLEIIRRLRPIHFTWKESGLPDVGLGAEEVAQVAPSFVYTNRKGEVEGVKYDRLNVVFINAIKQQQAQIQQQQQQLKQQQRQLDALTKLVCQQNPQANICK